MNNAKVLSALLGVWKNLRMKKLRLSPTLVTILVTSLSCNLALSAEASTYSKEKNREIRSQIVNYPTKKTYLLAKDPKSSSDRALSNHEIAKVEEEKINPRKSYPNCRTKVAASTPRCNSQHQSLSTKDRDRKQQDRKSTANTTARKHSKHSRQNVPSQNKIAPELSSSNTSVSKSQTPSPITETLTPKHQTSAKLSQNKTSVAKSHTPSPITESLTSKHQTSAKLSQNKTSVSKSQTPFPITETLTSNHQTSAKLSQNNTPTPENQTPPTTPSQQTPTPENQTPPTTPSQQTPTPENQTPTTSQEPRVLVAEVAVVGVEDELQDIVYETIETEPGRTTTRSQLQEDINAVYATGLFQNIEVTPEDTPLGVRLTFQVQANPILSEVVVDTIPPDADKQVFPPEQIEEIFSDSYGEILNLRQLQDGIKKINEWYSENGYELAQVVGSPKVSPDGTVTLVVAEGVIEDIQVRFFDEDNEPTEGKTRDFIVTREIELESGDVFKRDIAQRDLQRVFGLGIFEDVRLSFSPGENPSKVIVNVDVVESSTGSVAAGAGFSSSSGLFGTVSYQQKNLGGNNQTLATEFQLGERELLFDVSFTDPWIAGDPYRTSYTVNAFRRRSISLVFDGDDDDIRTDDGEDSPRVVRTGGGINFSRPLPANPFKRGEWTLSTGFQYQRVSIKNEDGDVSPVSRESDGSENLAFSDSGNDDLFILRFGATQDKRNNRLQPTSGSLLRLGLDQTVPIGSGSIFLNRLRGSYSYYVPLNIIRFSEGPQALAFNVQAGTVLGDLPPYEAFVIGGSNSVRGFAEGEVGNGRSYFQATTEYRFPIFKIVGGALFFDYGTVLGTDGDVPGEPSIRRKLPGSGFGYGLGIRVQSPLGPIRVDYAINDDGDNRIHFGIGERF